MSIKNKRRYYGDKNLEYNGSRRGKGTPSSSTAPWCIDDTSIESPKLEDAQGNHIMDHASIEDELVNYYKDLLSEPIRDKTQAIRKITRHIPSLITKEQNESLMRSITQEEVDQAVKEMPLGKTLGPDGFTTYFFHYCWSMIWERSLEASRGISNIWKIPLGLQCHFLHANSKGREGNPSKAVSPHFPLQ
jgi:hypothetical protein